MNATVVDTHAVPVSEVAPGDFFYIGHLVQFTVHQSTPGMARTWVLHGRVPPDHPLDGEGSEVTLELEREHRLLVHRPLRKGQDR